MFRITLAFCKVFFSVGADVSKPLSIDTSVLSLDAELRVFNVQCMHPDLPNHNNPQQMLSSNIVPGWP